MVVGLVGLALARYGKGRFEAVERRIDRLEQRMDARFSQVDARIDGVEQSLGGRIDGVERSIDTMRSDLTYVALAVGARPRDRNA
ncbi:MAG TPA: hypothetical protein VEO00_09355 [Actinomycetota bacterium]|nr:hypothetical protein [Actinomycetota bacterium]